MELFVRYGMSSTPGSAGTTARPPTLMKMRSAVSRSAPTLTSCADSNRACPSNTVQFASVFSECLQPVRDCAEISAFRAETFCMSTPHPAVDLHAKVRPPPRQVRRISASHHGFGRNAARY